MGAKLIKLGSWDKHLAYCWDLNVNVWHMRNEINVMEYFFIMMYYYVLHTIQGK